MPGDGRPRPGLAPSRDRNKPWPPHRSGDRRLRPPRQAPHRGTRTAGTPASVPAAARRLAGCDRHATTQAGSAEPSRQALDPYPGRSCRGMGRATAPAAAARGPEQQRGHRQQRARQPAEPGQPTECCAGLAGQRAQRRVGDQPPDMEGNNNALPNGWRSHSIAPGMRASRSDTWPSTNRPRRHAVDDASRGADQQQPNIEATGEQRARVPWRGVTRAKRAAPR